MATSYTSNKKIGALDSASTPLAATNEIVINQNGDILKTPLSAVEAKVFDAKTQTTTPTGTEVTIVRQTDGTLRQVPLANIVPALNITNAQISNSAAIVDTKLDTINTAGKVTNNAVQAVSTNTANRIVTRDGSGNFAAGTITATLSGNATTATTLQTGRTIALTGDVTYTSPSFNGSANVTAASTIANNAVTTAKIADANVTTAKIADANVTTAKIADANVTTAKIADANVTTAKVANDAIDNTKIRNSAALSVIGRSANSTGDPADIAAGTDGHVLRRSGTALGFGQVATAGITDSAVTTAKIADANVTTEKLATATQQSLVPAGAVMPFAMNSAPAGWLAANGTAVSRSTYAALFAAIGTTHGAGNGSTTFNLPDLRGIFVRGSDSQTISGTAYSGTFGAKQSQDTQPHAHGVSDPGHLHTQSVTLGPVGANYSANYVSGLASVLTGGTYGVNANVTGITIQNSTGTETRPANIALLYCIKF